MKYALLLPALLMFALPAFAQDAKPEADLKAAENFKDKAEDLKDDLQKKLAALEEGLTEKQRRHFGIIYYNHNMIATVETVMEDVGNAANACSQANPELKDKITSRFDDWKKDVNAKLDEAHNLTKSMIFAQDYATADEMKDALAAADTMRAHSKTIYEKVPVTSKDACEYLYEKMAETKDNMLSLLSSTLISVPQEMQKADDIEGSTKPEDETPAEDKPAAEPAPEKAEEKPAAEPAPAEAPAAEPKPE